MNDSTSSLLERLRHLLQDSPREEGSSLEKGLLLESLEPRVLYSASPIGLAPDAPSEAETETMDVAPVEHLAVDPAQTAPVAPLETITRVELESLIQRTVADPELVALSSYDVEGLPGPEVASLEDQKILLDAAAGQVQTAGNQELQAAIAHETAHSAESKIESSPLAEVLLNLAPES